MLFFSLTSQELLTVGEAFEFESRRRI